MIGCNTGTSGLHTTFAVSGDGVPLGVVNLEFDAPDGGQDRPVEERNGGCAAFATASRRRRTG